MEISIGRSSTIQGSEDVYFSIGGLRGFQKKVLIGHHKPATKIIDGLELGTKRDIFSIMRDRRMTGMTVYVVDKNLGRHFPFF